MPDTLTRDAAPRNRAPIRASVAGAVLAAALFLPVMAVAGDGARADVTVVNDTEWDLGVTLVHDDGSRLPVATIGAGRTRTVEEVLVPGDTWRLAWDVDGVDLAESEVADASLRGAGHRITVPAEVASVLRERGVEPSP
jgi:hypothetical protein